MKGLLPAAFFAGLLLSGCSTVKPPAPANGLRDMGDGAIEHASSGMRFPATCGGFSRAGVRQYDAAGTAVSVGYTLESHSTPIAITVYVYPSPPLRSIGSSKATVATARGILTHAEFQRAKGEILQLRPEATVVSEEEVPPPASVAHDPGYFGLFAYSESFAGAIRPVESLLYVYCYVDGNWTVKYRITYPAMSLDARWQVNQFIQELGWRIIHSRHADAPPSAG